MRPTGMWAHAHLLCFLALLLPLPVNCFHLPLPSPSTKIRPKIICGYVPQDREDDAVVARRHLCIYLFTCLLTPSVSAYTPTPVEPSERSIYSSAFGPLPNRKVLWVGSGDLSAVRKNLFRRGDTVIAVDLVKPSKADVTKARKYAAREGYDLRFMVGDATSLNFKDEHFDTVVSSMFLCQDFDPVVVVKEIRRVLKMGGRFGFYEHIEDIDRVVVDKVFGDEAVMRLEYEPHLINIMAGVVIKQ